MATLSEYFETEARDTLEQLSATLAGAADRAELHRLVRALRGTAQMAREARVYRAASAFEGAARALVADGLAWSEDIAARAADTLADLKALVEREEEDAELDARVEAAVERWRDAGSSDTSPRVTVDDGAAQVRAFREYAAGEVAGIADALDRGMEQLTADPMDREPLKMILRRQRALLGSARLDAVPVIAEILRAVEDLTRVIAKLDIAVKREWLDIYRVARDGLRAAIEPLRQDEDPEPSHALSRLRHMHTELLDRYGAGEAVSAAHETPGFVQATSVEQEPPPVAGPEASRVAGPEPPPIAGPESSPMADQEPPPMAQPEPQPQLSHEATVRGAEPESEAVPIEALLYSGDAALRRALELRPRLEAALAADPDMRAAVDELFDLLRLARQ